MSSVFFFMIDGLRPDAIERSNCPSLLALLSRSAYTLSARSVMPSITLPCHMSIFHSAPPERHGITTNQWQPMARPIPGLIEQAATLGKRCASFICWEPLRDVSRPLHLEYLYFAKDGRNYEHGDQNTADAAANYIQTYHPDFSFIYFGTVDEIGHDHGWMSSEYLAQIERVDRALDTVLQSLDRDSFVILQSDHGGHERMHGTDLPEDMTIPWMASGPGIRRNHLLQSPVSLLDTTPTLSHLLGIEPHSGWEGRVIDEIFDD